MKTVQLFDFHLNPKCLKAFIGCKLETLRASTMNDFNLCSDKKFMASYDYQLYILKNVSMFEL